MPIEVKSRPSGKGPYDRARAQLFAYCVPVEGIKGVPV